MSSLRTNSSLVPDAYATYARIDPRRDSEDFDSTNPPRHSRGMIPNQYPSSGSQRHYTSPRRREKCTRTPNNVLHVPISLPSLLSRLSHVETTTNGCHDPDRSPGSSSLDTYQSSYDSRLPFPSISEDSYPSSHSPDAIALFQIPLGKREAPLFDCSGERHDILDDPIQVIFEEVSDGTSTSMSTSIDPTPVRAASGRHDTLGPLRRRVNSLTSSVKRTRRKFPTIFHTTSIRRTLSHR